MCSFAVWIYYNLDLCIAILMVLVAIVMILSLGFVETKHLHESTTIKPMLDIRILIHSRPKIQSNKLEANFLVVFSRFVSSFFSILPLIIFSLFTLYWVILVLWRPFFYELEKKINFFFVRIMSINITEKKYGKLFFIP